MSVKIGNINLGEFPLLLAPMEDVSDPPFRALCKEHGADVMFTEFISSEGLIRNAKKSTMKLDIYDFERPIYYSDKSLDFYRLSYLDHYTLKGSTLSLDFVSLYAMTDPFEDFAESFMMYMRYRSEFKQISLNSRILGAKYSFFEQHFGNTKEVLVKPTPSLYLSSVIRPYDATLVHRKPSIGFVNP